jgi:mannose-6-phosphate isomerase
MTFERLKPSFREKVWGATHLDPWFPDSSGKVGEVWLEGEHDSPLLVKFLFTSERLSVQVHPGDAFARRHHDSRGKTEMWHILAAEPGSRIAAGFRENISPEQLRAAALSGEIEEMLQWFDAAPGDTFFIPAGTVHAIGAGLTLCEIQQNSDVTYRIYDYGRPRELHLEQALAVSQLGPHRARQKASGDLLVDCEYFTTKRICVGHKKDQSVYHPPGTGQLKLLIAIGGSGTVAGQPVKAAEALYIPPNAAAFRVTGDLVLLETSPRA